MKIFELLKNMGVLALGGICTKAISFLLLPLYTALISAEEYGTIDLLSTIATLLTAIVSFQMYEAIFKFVTIQRENLSEIKIIFTNIWFFCLIVCLLYSGLCWLLFTFLDFVGKWYILSAVIASIFLNITTRSSRGLGHNALYSFANFISALVTIALNLLFLLIFKWPAITILYASVIGSLLGGIICVVADKLWKYYDSSLLDISKIKMYLQYSLPLIPNEIAWWAIHASDRLVIAAFLGVYYTGLLAVASKFALAYSTIFSFFYASWVEQCFLHYNTEKGRKHIEALIPKIFVAFAYFTLILTLICMYIYPVVINETYSEAYTLIPWYLIAVLLNVIVGLVSPIYLIHNETKIVMYSTLIAGGINVLVNVLTVNYLGVLSAPVAAIFAYGSVGLWRLWDMRKRYLCIMFSKKNILELMCLLVLVIWVYYGHNEGYMGGCVLTMVFFSMIFEFSKYRKQN